MLVPIGIDCLLNHACYVSSFRVDSDDREWIRKAKDIMFGQTLGRDNWKESQLDQNEVKKL